MGQAPTLEFNERNQLNMNIKLQIEETIVLIGRQYGEYIFETQVQPHLTTNLTNITLIFPEKVENISTSFAGGLLCSLVEEHGLDYVKSHITIQNENLNEQIWSAFE